MNQKALDLSDDLSRKTAQLEALLVVACMETHDELSDDLKANYSWLCSDLATQIRSDFDDYHVLVTSQKVAKSGKPETGGES